jgi:hypothetical protein
LGIRNYGLLRDFTLRLYDSFLLVALDILKIGLCFHSG